jgi:hypothetical protein
MRPLSNSSERWDLSVRRQDLRQLEWLCRTLRGVFDRAGFDPAQVREAWDAGMRAECIRCGIHVCGEELFALSQPPTAEHSTVKIGRLRLGDCARQGCESFHYEIRFENLQNVDWSWVLAEVDLVEGQESGSSSNVTSPWKGLLDWRLVFGWRVAMTCLALVLALLWRQSYFGGRIPFVREPEQFRVDPAPEGEMQ